MVPLGGEEPLGAPFEGTGTEPVFLRRSSSRCSKLTRNVSRRRASAAVFDDRVGIGGYDGAAGALEVFVDTDRTIARERADRVYAASRDDSEPLAEYVDPPAEPGAE